MKLTELVEPVLVWITALAIIFMVFAASKVFILLGRL